MLENGVILAPIRLGDISFILHTHVGDLLPNLIGIINLDVVLRETHELVQSPVIRLRARRVESSCWAK
jgi:hypothetical protein